MGIPTITSISPTTGLTKGGNVVQIVGTNFRIPPPPPADGYLGGDAQRTVRVLFEGVAADAQAASDTLIIATVPEWAGAFNIMPLSLDVSVANLDDAGVEIPGEVVVSSDLYTISRPSIAKKSVLKSVTAVLVDIFRRHLLENSHVTMSRDFDEDPSTIERVMADLPVVYLVGPNTPVDRLRSVNQLSPEALPGDSTYYFRKEVPITTTLVFDIRIYSQGMQHTTALQTELMMLFRDVPYLPYGDERYWLMMPFNRYPAISNVPNQSDLYSVRAGCEIRGVHLDSYSDTIIDIGRQIIDNDGEPIVETQAIG